MRIALASSLVLVAAACGGAQKPAESSADTSSVETSNSSEKDMPAAPESAATPAPTASAAPSASASSEAPASAGPVHPTPSVSGSLEGTSFTPKLAHVVGHMQKDKRILVSLDESTDCPPAGEKVAPSLSILVPWEDGYKIDLSALKRASKKSAGEIGFFHTNAAGKKEFSTTFKPSGRLTVVKAPTDKDATGRLSIDLQSGDYMVAGDLDVQLCVAPK